MTTAGPANPVTFDVDYTEPLERLSSAFRLIWIIPIAIVLATVSGGGSTEYAEDGMRAGAAGAGGLLFLGPLLMILFRRKYPRWWFDWNLEFLRFGNRVAAYLALLTDRYPSTDEHQLVRLEIAYPDVERDLNRWLPLVKWLLAIPHYIVLLALVLLGVILVIAAWFAILFTGRYPRSLFDFIVGVMRWENRVVAYAFMLTTDRYPPFRLAP